MAMTRRKKVTAVHKVNSFHMTDGLFLRQVRAVAQSFPEVELSDLLVDASAAYMVRDPYRFDVIVTTNLYGDILSDLASELSGGLGLGGSIMAGDTFCCAQAQHGSAPDIQGQNKANPTSMILSVAMLMRWLGEHRHQENFIDSARRIEKAVDATLSNPLLRTPDIGGASGTRAFGDSVVSELVQ
jgi:3-isopropylmalate dehydrogenase